MSTIRYWRSLDCAHKLRLQFFLPRPPDPTRLAVLVEGSELRVDAFSKMAAGAKDHFELRVGTALRVTGVVGGQRVVATFRKSDGRFADHATRARFEDALARACDLPGARFEEVRGRRAS